MYLLAKDEIIDLNYKEQMAVSLLSKQESYELKVFSDLFPVLKRQHFLKRKGRLDGGRRL